MLGLLASSRHDAFPDPGRHVAQPDVAEADPKPLIPGSLRPDSIDHDRAVPSQEILQDAHTGGADGALRSVRDDLQDQRPGTIGPVVFQNAIELLPRPEPVVLDDERPRMFQQIGVRQGGCIDGVEGMRIPC